MKISIKQIIKIINESIELITLQELTDIADKPGKKTVDIEGQLDLKTLSRLLNVDVNRLKRAIDNSKKGSRSSADNAILADVFVSLLNATPSDTLKVAGILKRVQMKSDVKS